MSNPRIIVKDLNYTNFINGVPYVLKSKCCGGDLKILLHPEGRSPWEWTMLYACKKCGKPCDERGVVETMVVQ